MVSTIWGSLFSSEQGKAFLYKSRTKKDYLYISFDGYLFQYKSISGLINNVTRVISTTRVINNVTRVIRVISTRVIRVISTRVISTTRVIRVISTTKDQL